MSDQQFRSFLDLLMVSDPWPLDQVAHECLLSLASAEARKRGYDGWVVAWHEFKPRGIDAELRTS